MVHDFQDLARQNRQHNQKSLELQDAPEKINTLTKNNWSRLHKWSLLAHWFGGKSLGDHTKPKLLRVLGQRRGHENRVEGQVQRSLDRLLSAAKADWRWSYLSARHWMITSIIYALKHLIYEIEYVFYDLICFEMISMIAILILYASDPWEATLILM